MASKLKIKVNGLVHSVTASLDRHVQQVERDEPRLGDLPDAPLQGQPDRSHPRVVSHGCSGPERSGLTHDRIGRTCPFAGRRRDRERVLRRDRGADQGGADVAGPCPRKPEGGRSSLTTRRAGGVRPLPRPVPWNSSVGSGCLEVRPVGYSRPRLAAGAKRPRPTSRFLWYRSEQFSPS